MRHTAKHTTNGAATPPDAAFRREAALFIYTTLLALEGPGPSQSRRNALMAQAVADADELCRRLAG